MATIVNPYRGAGLSIPELMAVPFPSVEAENPRKLLERCPRKDVTRLRLSPELAERTGVGSVHVKDERTRMGLGSFKALGAAYVIAVDAEMGQARGKTYVTASAGNHGLSVAAGAAAFGARSVVFIAETVPEAFADRLREQGAEVVREGAAYEESMAAALGAAARNNWVLLSDSSWPGYLERPRLLMEGYLALMAEVIDQMPEPPSHIFLQAGVGGLAGACAALARRDWGDAPKIIVVEPDVAPALQASIEAGKPVFAPGPVSTMGRLDCKEPSLVALKGLARDADAFVTISEADGEKGAELCRALEMETTPSGAAGIAALLATNLDREALGLSDRSRVLAILSEGPEA